MQWIKRIFNQFIDLLSEASRANSAYVNNVPHIAPLVEPNLQALDNTEEDLRALWGPPATDVPPPPTAQTDHLAFRPVHSDEGEDPRMSWRQIPEKGSPMYN